MNRQAAVSVATPGEARVLALEALVAGGTQAALDAVLRGHQKRSAAPLDSRDRALATQLVYGVVKMRRALAWSLAHYLRKPLEGLDARLQSVLLLGAFQLLYLKKIPAHSAVDESVRLARRYGHAGTAAVANAVLRKLSARLLLPALPEDPTNTEAFATWASVPDWLARHWIDRFGFETAKKIAGGVNQPARRAVRVNTLRTTSDRLRVALTADGIEASDSRYGISECVVLGEAAAQSASVLRNGFRDGLLTPQSEESQLTIALLAPRADETLVDLCAGRGVKTGSIAQRMAAGATQANAVPRLYAIDDDASQLSMLHAEFQRLGLPQPSTICGDARRPYPPEFPRAADAVLVDAPCSGIGTVGRYPELRWSKHPNDPARLGTTQLALLAQAATIVRAGGRLLYAVCSTASEENESVIAAFLSQHNGWRTNSLRAIAQTPGVLMIGDCLLTVPGIDGADGFFYAHLVRGE